MDQIRYNYRHFDINNIDRSRFQSQRTAVQPIIEQDNISENHSQLYLKFN